MSLTMDVIRLGKTVKSEQLKCQVLKSIVKELKKDFKTLSDKKERYENCMMTMAILKNIIKRNERIKAIRTSIVEKAELFYGGREELDRTIRAMNEHG